MLWVGCCVHFTISELDKVEKVFLVISAEPFVFKAFVPFSCLLVSLLCALHHLCRYFKIYDTDDRQGLLEAYHDQVCQFMWATCGNLASVRLHRGL